MVRAGLFVGQIPTAASEFVLHTGVNRRRKVADNPNESGVAGSLLNAGADECEINQILLA